GAYVGPLLFAQGQDRPAAPPPTKVAVINVRAVLKQNARAKAFQAQLEESLRPFKAKAKKLADEIDALSAVKNPNQQLIAFQKGEWERVNGDIIRLIEDTHKAHMPAVWSDVNQAIDMAVKHYGFQVVLGYGNPDDPDVAAFRTVKSSKTRTMEEMGCTSALYVHGSVDLTPVVIEMLKPQGK
ncbi:MAG: OmpH family outer membrane protein, partial [Planctomycetes bacterium]|nr:OmpH family outer membrane protein [Planctomycetota bacterium]